MIASMSTAPAVAASIGRTGAACASRADCTTTDHAGATRGVCARTIEVSCDDGSASDAPGRSRISHGGGAPLSGTSRLVRSSTCQKRRGSTPTIVNVSGSPRRIVARTVIERPITSLRPPNRSCQTPWPIIASGSPREASSRVKTRPSTGATPNVANTSPPIHRPSAVNGVSPPSTVNESDSEATERSATAASALASTPRRSRGEGPLSRG